MLHGKKLGVLLSTPPAHPNFGRGLCVAEAALGEGIDVYLYCIDDAVAGIGNEKLQDLRVRGLKLFACAYGAQRRGIALSEQATFSGLTILSDIIAWTDRFLSFN